MRTYTAETGLGEILSEAYSVGRRAGKSIRTNFYFGVAMIGMVTVFGLF